MPKRNSTHVQELQPAIQAMVERGTTQREIAEHSGFKDQFVVKELLKQSRRKQTAIPRMRRHTPARTLQEYEHEHKRLKTENAMAENVFSILKTECIHRHNPSPFREANERTDSYIHLYNHARIQTKTRVAPLTLRLSSYNSIFPTSGLFLLSAQAGADQALPCGFFDRLTGPDDSGPVVIHLKCSAYRGRYNSIGKLTPAVPLRLPLSKRPERASHRQP